jgi:hypothetical protein
MINDERPSDDFLASGAGAAPRDVEPEKNVSSFFDQDSF